MSNRVIVGLKLLVHIACLAPFLLLAWRTYHDLSHPELPALDADVFSGAVLEALQIGFRCGGKGERN